MTDRQLMQQALNALCDIIPANANRREINRIQHSAIAALRERLAHCDRCGKRLGGEGDIHTCTPKPEREPARDFACKVCGSKPDAEGILEHGSGCYTQSENGGGSEFIPEAANTPPAAPAAAQREPVAWVDVKDTNHGPYEFHGKELLPVGKHDLYTTPPAANVQWNPKDHYNDGWRDAMNSIAAQPEQEPVQPLADAMNVVIKAMHQDPGYAWAWHCNIAMAFVDAGGDHYTGNQGAARFMRTLANVEPAHELPTPPAAPAAPPATEGKQFQAKFNIEDRVWYMQNNKPTEVIISAIEIFFVNTNQDRITYNAKNVDHSVSWLDHTNLQEAWLFKSKTELLESL